MRRFLIHLVLILWVTAVPAWAGDESPTPPSPPTGEDLKVIALMEILKMMDLAQEMEMVKEMEYLTEENRNEQD
jgi:hypothetical protein